MLKALPLILATMAPTFAQGMGADPATAKLVEMGTSGGFFVLAIYWMRQDWAAANQRLLELSKESLSRLERAYTRQQPED